MSIKREASSYFSPTPWGRPQGIRSLSSKPGRIPISKTTAYSWLRVQKIMEFSDQVTPPESESESLKTPVSPEDQATCLTRIESSSSSWASSVSTDERTNTSIRDGEIFGHTDPLACGNHAFVNTTVQDEQGTTSVDDII